MKLNILKKKERNKKLNIIDDNTFVLNQQVYTLKEVNVYTYLKVCELLDVGLDELGRRLDTLDLETIVYFIYFSIEDIDIDEILSLSINEVLMLAYMLKEDINE